MKAVTAEQMKRLDQMSEHEFGVTSLRLMENAGNAAAQEAVLMLKSIKTKNKPPLVIILCGRGNNGGDGIACARALKRMGVAVKVLAVSILDKEPTRELKDQKEKAEKEGLTITYMEDPETELPETLMEADLLVDALMGTGSRGKPAGPVQKTIQEITRSRKPVLALDIPSGIDADTGHHSGVFVTATKTVTFGLPKIGLTKPHAQKYLGQLVVANIGHPPVLLKPYLD